MRTGEGFLCVYSITSRSSFDEAISYYKQIVRVKDREDPPVVIVGNKCDLEDKREVSKEEGQNLAKGFNCKFIETSARGRTNVDEAFYTLVGEIQRINRATEQKNTNRLHVNNPIKKLKSRLCVLL